MATLDQPYDAFDPDSGLGARVLRYALYAFCVAAAAGLLYFLYLQFTQVNGRTIEAPPPQVIAMLPDAPPPPPPPPPKEKPPEPTEKPDPAPVSEAPKTPQQQAAPVAINAPAQASNDAYNVASGANSGTGAPGGLGTCLGTHCGAGPSGGGIDRFYAGYLSSALQERVQREDRVNRTVFGAEFWISISSGGAVTSVKIARSSGDPGRDATLQAVLERVRGLNPPPASLPFPQRIKVRGRHAL